MSPSNLPDFSITIHEAPVAKGRPKVTLRGKFPQVYTPTKTRKYEEKIRKIILEEMDRRGLGQLHAPMILTVLFRQPIPKSYSKKKRAAMLALEILPSSRPDLDNFEKSLLDAMQPEKPGMSGLLKEDAQIVFKISGKVYANSPGIDVTLWVINEPASLHIIQQSLGDAYLQLNSMLGRSQYV